MHGGGGEGAALSQSPACTRPTTAQPATPAAKALTAHSRKPEKAHLHIRSRGSLHTLRFTQHMHMDVEATRPYTQMTSIIHLKFDNGKEKTHEPSPAVCA